MKWKGSHYINGWKQEFALFPIKIQGYWIWLEHYDVSEPWYSYYNDDFHWRRRYPSQF